MYMYMYMYRNIYRPILYTCMYIHAPSPSTPRWVLTYYWAKSRVGLSEFYT